VSSGTIWESGAQNERTGLAWQRTTLSGLACSLIVARLLMPVSVVLSIAVAATALATAVVLAALSRQRYASNHRALLSNRPLDDARLYLAVTIQVTVTGTAALVYALSR
jgi:uncharacterized membrane protein YidH (DUF202 family)